MIRWLTTQCSCWNAKELEQSQRLNMPEPDGVWRDVTIDIDAVIAYMDTEDIGERATKVFMSGGEAFILRTPFCDFDALMHARRK